MIKQLVVGERYAQALLEVALAQGLAATVAEEVADLARLLQADPGLKRFLETYQVTVHDKKAALREVLGSRVSPVLARFLDLLLDKGRIRYLAETAEAFPHLYNRRRGIQQAAVVSARPLTDHACQQLTGLLERLVGQHVELTQAVDPAILGGVIVRMGYRVIDGSIRRQLTDLAAFLKRLPVSASEVT